MIKRDSEMQENVMPAFKGGDGEAVLRHLWKKGDEMNTGIKMLFKLVLKPGCSIGYHKHNQEDEIFLILQGRAEVDDNGTKKILETGDSSITKSGEGHSIRCLGEETMIALAIICTYPGAGKK